MHTVKRFDSVQEFVAATPTLNDYWTNGEYHRHASRICSYTQTGMPDLLAKAEVLLESLSSVTLESHAFVHTPDVWGQRLNMGEWLAGSPTCFRRKKRVTTDAAPMNVYVSQFASAGISTDSLINRGVAILALVAKLSQIRPIDLWLVNESMTSYDGDHKLSLAVRVESRPLNLSQASFCIGHPMFFRCLSFGYLRHQMGAYKSIPAPYDSAFSYQIKPYKDALEVTDADLYIPGSHLYSSPIISDPVNWINDQLAKYAGSIEEN